MCYFPAFFDFVYGDVFRWDETSDDDSGSIEPSNSENEHYSDYNRRPRRQAAVATKKKQAKRNAARRKNYSSGDDSDSDDEHKRCVLNVFSSLTNQNNTFLCFNMKWKPGNFDVIFILIIGVIEENNEL